MTPTLRVRLTVLGVCMAAASAIAQSEKKPVDPGVRGGAAGAGGPLQGLTTDETAFFRDGLARFGEIESVTGGRTMGLVLASIQISACPATPSRREEARAQRGTR